MSTRPRYMPSSTNRKRRDDREHQEQAALVKRIELKLPVLADYMAAVPNGTHTTRAIAGKLVAEGRRAGFADLLFDLPRGPYHGLRIEMKVPDATPSSVSGDQREWLARHNEVGFLAVVCCGQDEAFEVASKYYALGRFDLGAPELCVDLRLGALVGMTGDTDG